MPPTLPLLLLLLRCPAALLSLSPSMLLRVPAFDVRSPRDHPHEEGGLECNVWRTLLTRSVRCHGLVCCWCCVCDL